MIGVTGSSATEVMITRPSSVLSKRGQVTDLTLMVQVRHPNRTSVSGW
jgi:hypothetical protein